MANEKTSGSEYREADEGAVSKPKTTSFLLAQVQTVKTPIQEGRLRQDQ
jgi:hypothetical protein